MRIMAPYTDWTRSSEKIDALSDTSAKQCIKRVLVLENRKISYVSSRTRTKHCAKNYCKIGIMK